MLERCYWWYCNTINN